MTDSTEFDGVVFHEVGSGQIEARATRKQMGKIEKWISSGSGLGQGVRLPLSAVLTSLSALVMLE